MHTQTHIFQYNEKKFFKVHDWSNGQYETIITFVFDDALFVFCSGPTRPCARGDKVCPSQKTVSFALPTRPIHSLTQQLCVCV